MIDDPYDGAGGVAQYYTRMVKAVARHGMTLEHERLSEVARCNPKTDLLIVINQEAGNIPSEFAVIAKNAGPALETGIRSGSQWMMELAGRQLIAARRPRTFWVASSASAAYFFARHTGRRADRIIHGACDTDRFIPSDRQRMRQAKVPVVYHSCSDENKGDSLMEVMLKAADGSFEYRRLQCPHAEVPTVLREGDLWLCLSAQEGGPLTTMEAMSVGLIPVTTDVGFFWDKGVGDPLPSRADGIIGWRNTQLGGVVFDWKLRSFSGIVHDFIYGAWANRATLDPRAYALRWFNMDLFGQKWIEAIVEAAKRLEIAL
jgi:hypothetical protein